MSHSRIALLVIGIVLLSEAAAVAATPPPEAAPSAAAAVPVCNGKYKGGLKPSPAELADILKQHAEWAKEGGPDKAKLVNDPRIANLCEANLAGVKLPEANLPKANLLRANLRNANLVLANLTGAELTHADLGGALLANATLVSAHLDGARLYDAHIESANLVSAHLENAFLGMAKLMGANLWDAHLDHSDVLWAQLNNANFAGAHLKGANFAYSNVQGADFDLLPDSLPDPLFLSSAENLQLVKFSYEPAGLVKLRSDFKDLGLHFQESQLTFAIRRSELRRTSDGTIKGVFLHNRTERWGNYVLFDLTCRYGMSPGRPIDIVLVLAVLFSVVYVIAQRCPGPRGGIWLVWEENRIDKTEGSIIPQRLTAGSLRFAHVAN